MEDYSGIMEAKLAMLRSLVAQPVTTEDPKPCVVGDSILVGNKFHVTQPALLSRLGVTAVLNCAPSGIRNLPLDDYEEMGIKYHFTNCARDDENYPILHSRDGVRSPHLEKAQEVYAEVRASGGKVLFNCAAGQNRSATLAIAVQVCCGVPLQQVLEVCAQTRAFVVENVGFQRQLVELEAMMTRRSSSPSGSSPAARLKRASPVGGGSGSGSAPEPSEPSLQWLSEMLPAEVTVELVVPGLTTYNVKIPVVCSIPTLKQILIDHVDEKQQDKQHAPKEFGLQGRVGSAWLIFSMFGGPSLSLILEETAVERPVQLARLVATFGLDVVDDQESAESAVCWSEYCRFELVVFSVSVAVEGEATADGAAPPRLERPFTFRHRERPNAPGTLLKEAAETNLRAWDFTTGEAYLSASPIVFSFSTDPRQKREFCEISTSKGRERQTFDDPAKGSEGAILGMGANAVVHRVQLHKVKEPADEEGSARPTKQQRLSCRALSAEAVGSVLQRVELFSSLSPAEITSVAAQLQERPIAAGTQIVGQGDAGSTFYVVKSGIVKVFMTGAEGEEVVIKHRMGPGEYFGERALVTSEPRMASVVALTDVKCLCLSREAFAALRGSLAETHQTALSKSMLKRSRSTASASLLSSRRRESLSNEASVPSAHWDAAVKRSFRLAGMLASMGKCSEAGVAKRLRMAGALNAHGRLLYFYGVGICVASDYNDHEQFKFEACILSQYLEDFSSYTLKMFITDYHTLVHNRLPAEERLRLAKLQGRFSLIKVKVLLLSLLDGFRDLTRAGVMSFDFNHLNNVLISRDYRKARIIDIDGNAQGSMSFYEGGGGGGSKGEGHVEESRLHRPALDIDLTSLLPLLVAQLLLGKGRGKDFAESQAQRVRNASRESDDAAKAVIRETLRENFFPELPGVGGPDGLPADPKRKHLSRVADWFFGVLLKRAPWQNWTNDIYDAMRCIDFLPIA